ncbi:FecR domain-containing protein [Pantoea sp. SIMBA_072]
MNAESSNPNADKHAQEAAEWLTRLLSGEITSAERHDFEIWLNENEHHATALNEMRQMWLDLRIPLESELHQIPYSAGLMSLNEHPGSHRRQWGMAACLLLLVTMVISQWLNTWRYPYVTRTGEQKSWILEDGTKMWLNTNSAMDIKRESGEKHIRLVRGEGYFDTSNPQTSALTIEVGSSIITAFNTALNVFQRNDDTVITVDRGQVVVRQPGGKGVIVNAKMQYHTGQTALKADSSPELAADNQFNWKGGKIVFENQSLYTVLQSVKRYDSRWVLADSSFTKRLKLSTVIDIHDLDGWYRQLELALSLNIRKIGPVIWITEPMIK